MGNETSCLSRNDLGEAGWSHVISHVGFLSVKMIPGMIHRILIRNQS